MKFAKNQVWSFGKTSKTSAISTQINTPGPGRYTNISKSSSTNGIKFSKETRLKSQVVHTPGVGQYETLKVSFAPKYTISAKSNNKLAQVNFNSTPDTPGSGRYNLNDFKNNKSQTPKYSIIGKPKSTKISDNPGPGQYSINLFNVDKTNTGHTISKTKREINIATYSTNNISTPGPGRYNSDINNKAKSPSFSMKGKGNNDTFVVKKTPGPGSYINPDVFGKDAPKYSMPKNEHNKTTIDKNGYSNKSMFLSSSNMLTPGPGRYNINEGITFTKDNSKGFKLGTQKRDFKYSNNNPGPGEYSPKQVHKGKTPQYSLGKTKRIETEEDINKKMNRVSSPGPGRYNVLEGMSISSNVNKNKGFTMSAKPKTIKPSEVPGPGNYSEKLSSVKGNTSAFSFPRAMKSSNFDSVTPGPGRYNNNFNSSTISSVITLKFGKDSKNKPNVSETPGPGQYKIPCSIRDVNDFQKVGGKFDDTFKYV